MSANELRQAAETLRGRAGATTPDREFWTTNGITGWACDGSWVVEFDERAAAYIATMHPGVGLALADWLEQCADRLDKGHHTGSRHSHRIAALINGGAA